MESTYPGMWLRWYSNQCAAVGWAEKWGYHLTGPSKLNDGWSRARAQLNKIRPGDDILVTLNNHRVGRIGQVTSLRIGDDDWNPLVPPRPALPDGEMGRRIELRWDLAVGPSARDFVVALPPGARLTELRGTIAEVKSRTSQQLREVMNDRSNWVGLLPAFRYERAISDFIAAYPHRLEDGLTVHPDSRIREKVFPDRTRSDVLLIDRDDRPVVVECKQHAPDERDIAQLRRYMRHIATETDRNDVRGILVYSGSRKLPQGVIDSARTHPAVEVLAYSIDVEFAGVVN